MRENGDQFMSWLGSAMRNRAAERYSGDRCTQHYNIVVLDRHDKFECKPRRHPSGITSVNTGCDHRYNPIGVALALMPEMEGQQLRRTKREEEKKAVTEAAVRKTDDAFTVTMNVFRWQSSITPAIRLHQIWAATDGEWAYFSNFRISHAFADKTYTPTTVQNRVGTQELAR
ncbi:hypothetical protein BKA93DRAFT_591867 [Sparassis latifolia]